MLDKIAKEFLNLSRNPKTRKPNFKRVFEEMDADNSGYLDYDELKKALEYMKIILTDDEIATLIRRLDADGDGQVEYMEFIKFVHVGGESGDGRTSTDLLEDALTHLSRAIFVCSDHNFFNMRAECYFRAHDLKSCVSNLRYVLKLLPEDQGTRKRLARVLDLQGINWLKAKNFKAAESCFGESCKLDPVRATFWIHKSIALVSSLDYPEALRAVEQAMSVEQATADVYCLRGKIHWALNLTDTGNRDFRMAQELAPDHPEVVSFISAMIEKSGGFYREAMDKLQTIGSYDSSSEVREEEVLEAIRLLTQALALVPDDMRLLMLRSKAYRSIGNFDKSLTDIDDAAFHYCQGMLGDEVPKFVPNRRVWVETQSMKGKYREPVILTQQRSLTLNEMAMVEVRNCNYSKAISLLNRVIEEEYKLHDKDMTAVNAKFFVNRGDCYRATGKIEQAMSDFHRAYDADPSNWETKTRLSMIHYMAGLQMFNDGMYSNAEVEFTVAIKYNPKVSGYYESRGKACFYQYNYDGAYADYKEALKLDPGNREVLMRMQQFDPSEHGDAAGATLMSAGRGSNGKIINDIGGGIITVQRSRTAPMESTTMSGTGSNFLPSITPITTVNPRMKGAQAVKSFVETKRNNVRATLSVNERRRDHPIKKGNHWTVMEPKKIIYKSMTDRKALLERRKKSAGVTGKKKDFNQRKNVRLGKYTKLIFS